MPRGEGILCTSSLDFRIRRWQTSVRVLPHDERLAVQERIDLLLDKAPKHLERIKGGTYFANCVDRLPDEYLIAISLLHCTLASAWNIAFYKNKPIFRFSLTDFDRMRLLNQHMITQGWCRTDLKLLRQNANLLIEYYASRLGQVQGSGDHRLCAEYECVAHQVDEGTYETRHRFKDCSCSFVGIDSRYVAELIHDGHTPVITVGETPETSGCSIQLGISTKSSKYICYSHVWSNGLGNPHNNALPTCQLRYLQDRANDLDKLSDEETAARRAPPTSFWLDTLCVPVGRDNKAARSKAIAKMVC